MGSGSDGSGDGNNGGNSGGGEDVAKKMNVSGWWDGYTTHELHRLLYLHQLDPFGIAFIGGMLLVLLLGVGPPRTDPVAPEFAMAAHYSVWVSAILVTCAGFPLYFNIYKLPLSEKKLDPNTWAAMAFGGRFIYLTRWLITLQFLYFVTSLYAEIHGGWARAAIYALATPMAAMSTYVSVQFYGLVASTANYKKVVSAWEPRGIDVAWNSNVVHAPAATLGLIDLFLAKDAKLLMAARPSVVTLSLTVSAIACTYIMSAVINRQLTGVWPYSIMDSLDTYKKFAMFCVAQVAVLNVFLAIIWMLQTVVEATYSKGGL